MASSRQSIDELSKHVGLPVKATKDIVNALFHDMLISLYRTDVNDPPELKDFNEEMNKKVMDVYQKKYKRPFKPEVYAKNKNLSLFLMGPPGQGKTASYTAAAKEVCTALGLNFVEHVSDDYVPSLKDFVMIVQECAGENSAITFGGVPRSEDIIIDGKKVSVLKKSLNYRMTVSARTAGGVVLFDDAANAPTVIQNVLLPVAQNHTFQGLKLKNVCVGFTGNLGALDGTYVSDLSSALRTRVLPYFVRDNVKDFVNRAYAQYNDELGDLGMCNFILRNEMDFSVLPDPEAKTGFACPRSWDNLIQAARSVVQRNGGRGIGEAESLKEMQELAQSTMGPEIGHKITAYLYTLLMGADPMARNAIYSEEPDYKKVMETYGGGSSPEQLTFGYQFATACGDYASNLLSEEIEKGNPKALEVVSKKFGKAVALLNDSEFAYAIEHFKTRVAYYITDYSQLTNKGGRELKSDVITTIAKTISALPDVSSSKIESLLSVITDYDKISKAQVGVSNMNVRRKIKD